MIRPKLTWKYLGEGGYRYAYLLRSGRYVIKIPKDEVGERYNRMEYIDYTHARRPNIGRCRLIKYKGQDCLIMEYIRPTTIKYNQLPEWAQFIDCAQVGYNRKGKLLAYDWAL
jgi:hypothetical protein